MAHMVWYSQGTHTILGEASNPTEIFQLMDCKDQLLLSILKKCNISVLD